MNICFAESGIGGSELDHFSVLAQTGIETALHFCKGPVSGTVDSFPSGGGAFASQKALTIEQMWSKS